MSKFGNGNVVRTELKTLLTITKARIVVANMLSKAHYQDLAIRINAILDPKN